MTHAGGVPSAADDAPVRVASFAHAHEAELARIALASQQIDAVVLHDHGQYATAAPWVQLAVARRDRELAEELLERGPLGATVGVREPDDLSPLRLERRFAIARSLLHWEMLNLVFTGVLLPVAAIPLALAVWSRGDPRRAFAVAFFAQIPVCLVMLVTSGPFGLRSLIPLLAFYYGWVAGTPGSPTWLVGGPLPGTPSVAIGDAWNTSPVSFEPGESPLWMLRHWGVFLLVAIVLSVLGALLRQG